MWRRHTVGVLHDRGDCADTQRTTVRVAGNAERTATTDDVRAPGATTAVFEWGKMKPLNEITKNARLAAVDFLADMGTRARTNEELHEKMGGAQIYASHILATLLFNSVQKGCDFNLQLAKVVEGIMNESRVLVIAADSGQMIVARPNANRVGDQ